MGFTMCFRESSVFLNIVAATSCLALTLSQGPMFGGSLQAEAVVAVVSTFVSTVLCLAASQSRESFYTWLQIGSNLACAVLTVTAVNVEGYHLQIGLAFSACLLASLGGFVGLCAAAKNIIRNDYQMLV